jgi:hypothetical protein
LFYICKGNIHTHSYVDIISYLGYCECATTNLGIQDSLLCGDLISFRSVLRSGITGSYCTFFFFLILFYCFYIYLHVYTLFVPPPPHLFPSPIHTVSINFLNWKDNVDHLVQKRGWRLLSFSFNSLFKMRIFCTYFTRRKSQEF